MMSDAMIIYRKVLIALAAFMCVLAACRPMTFDDTDDLDCENQVTIVLQNPDTEMRSSLELSETAVENLSLYVYHSGKLVTDKYFTDLSDMSVTLRSGEIYSFYVLANTDKMLPPLNEKAIMALTCPMNSSGKGMPMCWKQVGVSVTGDRTMYVKLIRLMAKIVLNVKSNVPGLSVSSVSLIQAPFCVRPFAPSGSKAAVEEVAMGDVAPSEDIAILNNGGDISFYMFENMQGILLEGNEDPMKKVPDNIASSADVCTYLDVRCDFTEGNDKEGNVSYRIYLGRDNVADFNIERNSVLKFTLTLTPDGLGIEESWKVDPEYTQHAAQLVVDRSDVNLVAGCSVKLNAMVLPDDASNIDVRWISDDESVAVVDSEGMVEAVGKGECVVRAVSEDRSEVYDECIVRVVPVMPESVELNFSEHTIALGDTFTAKFRVRYNDGTVSSFTSYGLAPVAGCSPEGWEVSDPSVLQISTYGVVRPSAVGLSEVSMTVGWWDDGNYRSCTAIGYVDVTDAYLTDVYVLAPAMFYDGSEGPGLFGVFSDGVDRKLVADEWVTSIETVCYDEENGIMIEPAAGLTTGRDRCTFTAFYNGMSASIDMVYGKWVREIRCVKTVLSGSAGVLYRLYVVYDDFSEEAVPFLCQISEDGLSWEEYGVSPSGGIVLNGFVRYVRLETRDKYYDYSGQLHIWRTEVR